MIRYVCLILSYSLFTGMHAHAQATTQLLDSAVHYQSSDFNKTVLFSEKAYQAATGERNKDAAASAALLAGKGNYLSGNHDLALKWYLVAEKLYLEGDNHARLAAVYNEMVVFYSKYEKFEAGYAAGSNAITRATIAADTPLLANAYNNLGLLQYRDNKNDSALLSLKKAYELYQQVNDPVGMSYSLDYLASVVSDLGDQKTALAYLKQSRQLKTKASDKMGEAIITNNIGEALLQQNGYAEALDYFREARRKAHELKFNDLEAHTWLMEAKASEGLKDFTKAYAAISGYLDIHDQVLNEKRIKAIEELQTKYETDKKEQENILLQQQNQVQALELGQRKIIILALLTVVLLIAGISYLLYTRSRLRQQARMSDTLRQQQTLRTQAVIEAEEHERQRLARELHDGVGQMLAATRRSLQVSDHVYQNTGAAATEPLTLIDESIRELRQLSHQMMPPSLRNKNLVEALTELLERTGQSTPMDIHTSWTGMESTVLDKTQTLMLYRTVQEILSNIIRHANASEVHVELVRHDTELNLMVYDDGKGFDLEEVYAAGRGLGLKNIRSRIAYIGGELELDTTPGNGTTYMINLPLQKID